MEKKIKIILSIILLLCNISIFAQPYPTGGVIDPTLYDSIPRRAVQLSRSYSDIPSVYSVKHYGPQPYNQNGGTCTAWASAYAARTITESITIDRRDWFLTTRSAFSPYYIFRSVRHLMYKDLDPTGEDGIAISYALDFMKSEGAVRILNNEVNMLMRQINVSMYSQQKRYPIADYVTLYQSYLKTEDGDPVRTKMVKKSISEGKPVIIAIKCPPSFHEVGRDGVWYPKETSAFIDLSIKGNAHALCVVGYDDNRYGGAFEIQNSWGTGWANGGFVWIPYTVFNQFAYEAYEIIENLANYETIEYSGSVKIEVYNSKEGMPVRFNNGYYQTNSSYSSGASFRYILSNGKPAYVYAFSGDSGSNNTNRIFPPEKENISPILDYSENIVAFPGEFTWIQLDERIGTDYLVVLFAKEALDIDNIRKRFESASGSFPARVSAAVGSNLIPVSKAKYEANEMRFSAQSANPKAILGLLLAIDHRAR